MLMEAIKKALRGQAVIIRSVVDGESVQLVKLPPGGGLFVPDANGETLRLTSPQGQFGDRGCGGTLRQHKGSRADAAPVSPGPSPAWRLMALAQRIAAGCRWWNGN